MTSVALGEFSKVTSDAIRVVSTWALKIAKLGVWTFIDMGREDLTKKSAAKLHYRKCRILHFWSSTRTRY